MVRAVWLVLAAVAVGVLYQVLKRVGTPQRHRAGRWVLALVLVLGLSLALARFGLHWVPVVGAAALALLRQVLPWLVRLFPFFARAWFHRSNSSTDAGSSAGDPSTAEDGVGTRFRRSAMTREEALQVLDLREGAPREEILAAYRRLMKRVHPDFPGGSKFMAQKLNQAKETLLD